VDSGGELAGRKGSAMTVATRAGISDNAAGAISYFTFIPAGFFLLVSPYKNSSFVRFHAWQSLLLFMTAFVVEIVIGAIALLTLFLGAVMLIYTLRAISVMWLILWIVCMIKAINGKKFKVLLLGNIAEKLSMK
jgi:uncharacterized membrane protein